jgi:hypothetical protein
MSGGITDELSILVGGRARWTDEQFVAMLDEIAAHQDKHGPTRVNMLYSGGQATTQNQRLRLKEYNDSGRIMQSARVALLTESALIRSVGNASRVLFRKISFRLFAPTDLAAALSWLNEAGRFDPNEARRLFLDLLAHVGYGPEVIEKDWRSRMLGK